MTSLDAVASPNPIYSCCAPSTETIVGSGFDPTYGMPLVQYYDATGTLVDQETASSVSPDGTTIQIAGFSAATLTGGV
ncbi:MAG: hypothetical protein WBE97_13925, partial [Candidatus Acidiferrales bacterium]